MTRKVSAAYLSILLFCTAMMLLTAGCAGGASSVSHVQPGPPSPSPSPTPAPPSPSPIPTPSPSPTPTGGASPAFAYAGVERLSSDGRDTNGFLTEYSIDATSGALVPIAGSPFSISNRAYATAAHPSGRFIYTAEQPCCPSVPFDIGAYRVDPGSGALTRAKGVTVSLNFGAGNIAVDGTGKHLYAAADGVHAFSIDQTTGDLTEISNSPFSTQETDATFTTGVATDAAGRFLFALDTKGRVVAFVIDQSSGALTLVPGSPFAAGTPFPGAASPLLPNSAPVCDCLAVDSSGRFLYVTNGGSNNVTGFSINSDGTLHQLAGSPFAAGSGPVAISIDPNNKWVFVPNFSSDNLSVYKIDSSSGLLSPAGTALVSTGHQPGWISVDASGNFVYVTNSGSNNITAYQVQQDTGVLAQVPGSPFATDSNMDFQRAITTARR